MKIKQNYFGLFLIHDFIFQSRQKKKTKNAANQYNEIIIDSYCKIKKQKQRDIDTKNII